MIENIRLAFQGIWSHKMRSFLTMLGIIIGIAAIMAIVSTIKGTNDKIKEQVIGSGKNTVSVSLSQGGFEWSPDDYGSSDKVIPQIQESTMKQLRELDEVEEAASFVSRYLYDSEGAFYGNASLSALKIYGVDQSYFNTCSLVAKSGRLFGEEDYDRYRGVLILDETAAASLFQRENPIGKNVEISGMPFTVIGVVAEQKITEININSIDEYNELNGYGDETNGSIFIPKATWPVLYKYDQPENVVLKAKSTNDMTKAGQKAVRILNANLTDTESTNAVKYKATDLQARATKMQQMENTTRMQLFWIAGISLLVGGIGVMNIMLVSVTERTSEIGLKKAIGARRSTILAQFLTEAAVLTSLGGFLGVLGGIGASQVIHHISGVDVGIDIPASVFAVGFSMAIGLIFGFLPSVQAANLDPIEALRRE